MPVLQVIIASTRPGRKGPAVAEWIAQHARDHGTFDVELVDLQELALPNYDEPNHPATGIYEHEHTKQWSAKVARADAFAFVIPEYNHTAPPALLNAIDFVSKEWNFKPVGLVSYGGVSAGLRSAQAVKESFQTLKLVAASAAVSIPFVANFFDDDGELQPNDVMLESATAMLDELVQWEGALRTLRAAD